MIKKKIKLSLLVFLSYFHLTANAGILSDQAKISLITIGPGQELYSSFGHSAFWVYDPVTQFDRIYNYGTFDFNEPNFYGKFIQGKLLYRLSISDMGRLVGGAQYENRWVIEQILNLSPELKDKLFQFLENNYLPQNRAYKYDFFFDNCSTRMRDALKTVCGDSLDYNLMVKEPRSFRQLLDPFLLDKQWQDMGMDIGLGTPADRIATPYDYMYLPEHLKAGFASATLKSGNHKIPLVKETKSIFEGEKLDKKNSGFTPTLFFWLLFFAIALFTFYQFKKENPNWSLDTVLLVITGLLGFLIVFLWFGTDHPVTKNNWNLIWAMPLNFIAVFFIIRKNSKKTIAGYFLIYGILTSLLLISWSIIPQELNAATFPLILALALRAFFIFYKYRSSSLPETT